MSTTRVETLPLWKRQFNAVFLELDRIENAADLKSLSLIQTKLLQGRKITTNEAALLTRLAGGKR